LIFRELVLQNFGPYRERQAIQFAPGDSVDRLDPPSEPPPLVLLGGLNGGGKTTLLDAIRLALYGQRSKCSTRGNLSYSAFLRQCINRHAADEELTCIELAFQETLNGQPHEFRVLRSWNLALKCGKDNLEVSISNRFDKTLTQSWDERIEDILPLGISNLFLFDGEQIKELAEQDALPSGAIEATRILLGLELPDLLSRDLNVLINRKLKELDRSPELSSLDDLQQELEAKRQECEAAEQDTAAIYVRLKRARVGQDETRERFIIQGGKLAGERELLARQLEQMQIEVETHQQSLKELAAGALPLVLLQPLLKQAQTQGHKELQHQQYQIAKQLLAQRDRELLELIARLNLPVRKAEQLQVFLKEQNRKLETATPEEKIWLNADRNSIAQLEHTLKFQLPAEQQSARQHLLRLRELEESIDTIQGCLATAASPETYERLIRELETAEANVISLSTEYAKARALHEKLLKEHDLLKKQLIEYTEAVIARNNDNQFVAAVDEIQKKLQIFREQLKLRKLNQLESLITECFHELVRKSDLVQRVAVDPETFALSLFDHHGRALSKHRLSAGEKQMLATALLWALARASNWQLPVAIDTPLGRLDSYHKQNLVDRYFPQASHQVILLSTDTEIGKTEVQQLRKKALISYEYLLKYDSQKHQTVVVPGYF
jgi:DNA sulfur modification protein DndD